MMTMAQELQWAPESAAWSQDLHFALDMGRVLREE